MGHIWGPVLQHMELFQHMGKKILQKAQHMGNIWVFFSNIWGSFEIYRSFLKHMHGDLWPVGSKKRAIAQSRAAEPQSNEIKA